jgi:hypothetical protein
VECKEIVWQGVGLDSCGSGYKQVAGCCDTVVSPRVAVFSPRVAVVGVLINFGTGVFLLNVHGLSN